MINLFSVPLLFVTYSLLFFGGALLFTFSFTLICHFLMLPMLYFPIHLFLFIPNPLVSHFPPCTHDSQCLCNVVVSMPSCNSMGLGSNPEQSAYLTSIHGGGHSCPVFLVMGSYPPQSSRAKVDVDEHLGIMQL